MLVLLWTIYFYLAWFQVQLSRMAGKCCAALLALYPGIRTGRRGGGGNLWAQDNLPPSFLFYLFFPLRESHLGFACICTNPTLKGPPSTRSDACVLPEAASFTARSSFCCAHQLSPHSEREFFDASSRHHLTETLKEQMYWRNASICYLLQFGGVCPMGIWFFF